MIGICLLWLHPLLCRLLQLCLGDALVGLGHRLSLHGIGDVGIGAQGSAAGHMADDGREGLHVHAVLQRHGGEGVAQVVEAHLPASRPLQNGLEPLADVAGGDGLVGLEPGGEQPGREHLLFVLFQHLPVQATAG